MGISEKHSAHQRARRYDVFMMAKAEENSDARCANKAGACVAGSRHLAPRVRRTFYASVGLLSAWERWLQCLLACWRFGIADHQRIQTKRLILSL